VVKSNRAKSENERAPPAAGSRERVSPLDEFASDDARPGLFDARDAPLSRKKKWATHARDGEATERPMAGAGAAPASATRVRVKRLGTWHFVRIAPPSFFGFVGMAEKIWVSDFLRV